MSDKTWSLIKKLAIIDFALMIIVPFIWSIIFWNSPLLIINAALVLIIGCIFCLGVLGYALYLIVRNME